MAAPRVTIDQLPEQTVVTSTDLFVVQNGATTKKMTVQRIVDVGASAINNHLVTTTDAHDASAISAVANVDPMIGADVQTQLSQAANRINSNAGLISGNTNAINDHVNKVTGAHTASAIAVVPIAGATGINVQALLQDLVTRVQALEAAQLGG